MKRVRITMFKGFVAGLKYLYYSHVAKPEPCDGAGIDAYDTEHLPLEQRVIRLEKGRDGDYEFLSEYIDNLKTRIERLEEQAGL